MRFRLLVLTSCFVNVLLLSAQPREQEYQFRRFLSGDAFSDENVRSVFQDSRGYLWMSVDSEGLCRYDGSRFQVFGHQSTDTTSISSNYVNDIKEDSQGNIWLATERGLNVFDQKARIFTKVQVPHLNPRVTVNTIFMETPRQVWVGTEDGLLSFDVGQALTETDSNEVGFEGIHYKPSDLSLKMSGVAVTCVVPDLSGGYWLGTRSGLYHYSATGVLRNWRHSHEEYAISDNEINSMVRLGNDHLLIGSDNGVNIFDQKSERFSRVEFRDSGIFNDGKVGIVDIYMDSHNTAWIGTTTYGVITGKLIHTQDSLSPFQLDIPGAITGLKSSYITDIFEDHNHQIIVATKFGGLFVYDRRGHTFPGYYLEHSEAVADQDQSFIISAAEDHEGFIWIGTRDRGLIRFDPERHEYLDVPIPQGIDLVRRVEAIFCDDQNNIWIGHKKGLNRLNSKSFTSEYFEIPKVIDIDQDEQKMLWIGTRKGVYRFDPSREMSFRQPSQHALFANSEVQVSRIEFENRNRVWIGTDNQGLYEYDVEQDRLVQFANDSEDPRSLSGNAIRSIFKDSKGQLWVGTKSSGLNLYENGGFSQFNEMSGLPSNTVFSILEDHQGLLWIATNNGLSRFDVEKGIFNNFTKRHGLQGNVFEKYASLKLRDDRFFLAGNNGFNLFDPVSIKMQFYDPPLVICEIRANTQVVSRDIFEHQELTLPYNKNILSFEFAALDYRDVNAIQYQYMLEGVNDHWVSTGNKNQVTYSNLPYGQYEFKVRATNADGMWAKSVLSTGIYINRPPWLAWWAKTIYVFLMMGVLYFIYWLATLRTNYLHKIQTKEMELSKSNELTQLKLNFFTNISHELRTPLTLILAPLENLRKSHHRNLVNKSVTTAYRSARQLLHLTDQLMFFRKVEQGGLVLRVSEQDLSLFVHDLMQPFQELAESKGIILKIRSKSEPFMAYFDPDKLEKIINNLMINAFKFTPSGGKIELVVKSIDSALTDIPRKEKVTKVVRFQISDNGEGIDQAELEHIFDRYYQVDGVRKGNGIGLELVKSLVQMHHGAISAESTRAHGTCFKIDLPVSSEIFSREEIVIESAQFEISENSATLGHLIPATSGRKVKHQKDKPKLLIVEDHPELLEFLSGTLMEDFNVKTATDGLKALTLLSEEVPDMVLSDVMMPNSDGVELCRNIKENLHTSHIPVVLLTARSMDEHQIEGFEGGADAYIVKPFDVEVLKARLHTMLRNRELILDKLKTGLVFEPDKVSENKLDVGFLSRIIGIIEENYARTDFNVEEFALDLNMSRSQLFRKMRSLTGQTPSEYLYAFRIKKAIELLEMKELNIAEIAYRTGFSSPNSFSKTFAKHIGVSPSKYYNGETESGSLSS